MAISTTSAGVTCTAYRVRRVSNSNSRAVCQRSVSSGDAQVEGALAHVHGDVARPQVVELDAVVLVEQHQILGIVALPVPRLAQHLGGRLGEGALVGHGDLQRAAF